MIHHPCKQGSEKWHDLRLGIPTASEFSRIITPTGKMSSQADDYLHRLLAEWVLGAPLENIETSWMQHGHEFEDQAAKSFEFEMELELETVGFITTDDGLAGASPDRIVKGKKRGVELKCPAPNTHIGYMLSRAVDEKYKPQVQGQIYVAELDANYIQSYCPGLPTVIVEVGRDEPYIGKLRGALDQFADKMLAARADLEKRFGPFRRPVDAPKVNNFQVETEAFKAAKARAFGTEGAFVL